MLLLAAAGCQSGARASKDGATLYDVACVQCHAPDGKGDAAWKARLDVPDLTDPGLQARLSDADIFTVIRDGSKSRKMPPWGGALSEEQMRALVAHVRTFRK